MLKVFEGANGYYVAEENNEGFHHQPADNGARLGWDWEAAMEALEEAANEEGCADYWGGTEEE